MSALDLESKMTIWKVFANLRDRGSTVLFTTHYLEEVEEISTKVAVLHKVRTRSPLHSSFSLLTFLFVAGSNGGAWQQEPFKGSFLQRLSFVHPTVIPK